MYFLSDGFGFPGQLRFEGFSHDEQCLNIHASTRGEEANCPECGFTSRRVHSTYWRKLADLPWSGVPVRLRVRVRKFFCDERSCERRIFAERLKEVARPFARGTDRRAETLEWIAFALGGEAGARLARELGLLVSPDTLLGRIRGAFSPSVGAVRVLGVDDFAFRKGNAYGTILVDLERRRVVDILPECSQDSLASWLRRHPGVEVATRDRSRIYREGIAKGAPEAAQVAAAKLAGTSSVVSPSVWRSSFCANGPSWGRPSRPLRARRNDYPTPSRTMFRPCPSVWDDRTGA